MVSPRSKLFSSMAAPSLTECDCEALISFISWTSSTQPNSLTLNRLSLGSLFDDFFRRHVAMPGGRLLRSPLGSLDPRPVRTVDHHRRKKCPKVGRHAQIIPTNGSTDDQINTGAMVQVASASWVLCWREIIRQILAAHTLGFISLVRNHCALQKGILIQATQKQDATHGHLL